MLLDALLEVERQRPGAAAVRDPTRTLTFRQLTTFALAMRKVVLQGTGRDRVGIMLPATAGFTGTFFGVLWAGKTAVPLNFLLSTAELADIVRDADIDLIISTRHFDKTTADLPSRIVRLEELPIKRLALMTRLSRRPPAPKVDPDELAVLLYTSGTTGACKGVELSERALKSNADALIKAMGLREDDRFLCVLPPFHVFGLAGGVLVPTVRGITSYVIPRFSPTAVLRTIEQAKPTTLMAIPSMYGALLRAKSAKPDTFKSFRMLMSGGEPLPDAIYDGFRERFGAELMEGYGLTETSPVIAVSTSQFHKHGTVGKPLHNIQVRIVAPDGEDTDPDAKGEIIVRGPSVMRGYHNRPDETAAVLDAEGWFSTGDIGMLDADGFLYITGRKKDIIIVGGENVFPGEIEEVLMKHPQVTEAAVIGVPDTSRGETTLAFVMLKDAQSATELELRSFAREQLAGYKVPRRIRIVDDMPRGPTGKVQKRKLREMLDATS